MLLLTVVVILFRILPPTILRVFFLSSTAKCSLIGVICDNLPAHFQEDLCNNKLIVPGANAIPDDITVRLHIKIHGMAKRHEEANVCIFIHNRPSGSNDRT